MDLPFHLLMTAVDVLVLFVMAHRRGLARTLVALILAAEVGLLLAFVLRYDDGSGGFGFMGLAAQAIFLHGPFLLLASAWLLRTAARRSATGLGLAGVLLAATGGYAFWIEPFWLEITRLEISSPKLQHDVRIVVLADIQTDVWGDYERRALRTAMAEQPDLVLMAGDYLQIGPAERRAALQAEAREYLRQIDFGAPLGVFAARGDVETRDWMALFDGLPVTPVRGTKHFEVDGMGLNVLSPMTSRNTALEIAPAERFQIVLGHAPDFALGRVEADLLVAGHTHGGQVRIPGFGPILKYSKVPRSWAAGVTDLGGGRTLVVSRGIGMERGRAPRLRLFCRPQIVVIDLRATAAQSLAEARVPPSDSR